MLKKTQRISTNQVSWLLKKGFRFNNEFFSVKFQLNKGPANRYSVVVSKKISALAVERNLLRRQLYEILGKTPTTATTGDYMLIVKPQIKNLSFEKKTAAILQTLQQISSKLN
jgi:ribonuclease P protein component